MRFDGGVHMKYDGGPYGELIRGMWSRFTSRDPYILSLFIYLIFYIIRPYAFCGLYVARIGRGGPGGACTGNKDLA